MKNFPARLQNIRHTWPSSDIVACNDITLELNPGTIHALVGENGAGKTTLGHILAGVQKPDNGKLTLGDTEIELNTHNGSVLPQIGLVRQKNIWPTGLKVWEAAVLGNTPLIPGVLLRWQTKQTASGSSLTANALIPMAGFRQTTKKWGIAAPNPKMGTSKLDAVDLQRCQLVAALMRNPRFLVLDEPVPDWGSGGKEFFYRLLQRFANAGLGVLLITHRLEDVFNIASWITIMRKGEIVATGPIMDYNAQSAASLMFGDAPTKVNKSGFTHATGLFPEKKTVLECRDISHIHTLKSTNFKVCAGEIFGIAGIRGEGLLLLERIISGHLQPVTGSLLLNGQVVSGGCSGMRRAGLSYIPSEVFTKGASLDLTVADNMAVLDIVKLSRRGIVFPKDVQAYTDACCNQGRIMARPDQSMAELSAGNIQKVILQRELIRSFTLCLMADPFTGLDRKAGHQLVHTLKDLTNNGAAILILASDIDEVISVADRIAVISRGVLGLSKPAADWDRNEAAALMVGA